MKKLSHYDLSKVYAGNRSKFLASAFIRTIEYGFDRWIEIREEKIALAFEKYSLEQKRIEEKNRVD